MPARWRSEQLQDAQAGYRFPRFVQTSLVNRRFDPTLPRKDRRHLAAEGQDQDPAARGDLGYGRRCAGDIGLRQRRAPAEGPRRRHSEEGAGGVHLLGIRSRTQLTDDVIGAADSLIAVGCFSVGTNQVDLAAAQRKGIPVFNAPFSNTRSVAELTMAEIVMLFRRRVPQVGLGAPGRLGQVGRGLAASCAARRWASSATATSAASSPSSPKRLGMRVIYHDRADKLRHGNVEPAGSPRGPAGARATSSPCTCRRRQRPRT